MTDTASQPDATPTRQDFERQVVARAVSDPAFRSQLLADSRAALRAAYGFELPTGVDLQVVEETESRFYLVLPAPPAELTDEQLASVSGGVGSTVAASGTRIDPRNATAATVASFGSQFYR